MDIAFNINPLGLEGLGATVSSLLRNCSKPQELKLWFLCNGCQQHHKQSIQVLLSEENFSGEVSFIDFAAEEIFGHLRPLHGDWTGYGRLLIPDYIPSDTVLYLDADLIVLADVLTLSDFQFGNHFLAAVPGGKIKYALERNFLINQLGLSADLDYFNSGVLLLNVKEWKAQNVSQQWKKVGKQFPAELLAIDQTLLNAVCKGQFAHLPIYFNTAWCPGDAIPEGAQQSVLHFVGSPKPWDLFGKTLHQGYDTWNAYSTAKWNKIYNRMTWNKVVRTWKIKNSILLKMKKKYIQQA